MFFGCVMFVAGLFAGWQWHRAIRGESDPRPRVKL